MANVGSKPTPRPPGEVRPHRLGTSAAVFVVVAVGIYLTAYLAIGLIQHVVMPILAVVVAAYLARLVYRFLGGGTAGGGTAGGGTGTT